MHPVQRAVGADQSVSRRASQVMTYTQLVECGYPVSEAAYWRLVRFVELLLTENRHINLTAARDPATLWRRHICDSLALWVHVPGVDGRKVVDLGSGGGLPGIPLACVCETATVTLVDATRKKVAALDRIVAGVGLTNAAAVWGRAETLARDPRYREQFEVVVARAVATLPVLVAYAAGLVRPGGECWFFKTQTAVTGEVPQAASAARACLLAPIGTVPYRLPEETDDRLLVGYRKLGSLPDSVRRTKRPDRKRSR
jgi:16S rRNA (guanine527-N7)-methyltransferase